MENSIYTVDYFLAKFRAIPSEKIGNSQSEGCAYGQCRTSQRDDGAATREGMALTAVMQVLIPNLTAKTSFDHPPDQFTPARINNGETNEYQQATPKERLIAALEDIKKLQHPAPKAPEVVERVVYKTVVIDEAVKNLQETLTQN